MCSLPLSCNSSKSSVLFISKDVLDSQGGDLFCCTNDSCPNAFCLKCVKRNLGRTAVSKIEDSEEWKCFECEPKQVREQRLLFFSILAFWKKVDEKVKKRVDAKKAKEKAKNRSDCLTKTYQLASQCNLISKNFVTKNAENWAKNPSKFVHFHIPKAKLF